MAEASYHTLTLKKWSRLKCKRWARDGATGHREGRGWGGGEALFTTERLVVRNLCMNTRGTDPVSSETRAGEIRKVILLEFFKAALHLAEMEGSSP